MSIRALVFDMDGTLLHTMPDLAVAANDALTQMGFPTHTQDEMLAHMGRGGRWLIEQIVPAEATAEQRQQTFDLWRKIYIGSGYTLTAPYDGIESMLREVRLHGVKTAVLSNKFHEGACALAQQHFPGLFEMVRGDMPPLPRKPDPTSLLQMLSELGVTPDEAAYVGDSIVDAQTARNAGVKAIGVAWGYDQAAPLPQGELDAYVRSPAELVSLCL